MRDRLTAKNKTLTLTIPTRADLYTAMARGATVITPNNRLSNQLLSEFFKQTPARVKNKPSCLPYQAFLRERYKKARHLYANIAHPILLTQHQQRYLWQQIILQDGKCNEGLLAEVQEAWRRCQYWQIDSHHKAFSQTPQTRQFQQWQHQLQQHLTTLGALTEEQLATHLLTYPDLFAMGTVIWACFDDYTPQQCSLQQAIDDAGCHQYSYDLVNQPIGQVQQYAAKDCRDENLQLIQWLKNKLAAEEPRIAVVVPNLQTRSHQLQRLLQHHISPKLFNISLGQALIDYPLVAHALQWLNLEKQTLSNYQTRLLLHSSYLAGSKDEFGVRTNIVQQWEKLTEPFISFSDLIKETSQTAPRLSELLSTLPDYPEEATPHAWTSHFKARLTHLGFPGDYPLISSAYQCFQRLMRLFDDFMQVSVVGPLMSKARALDALYGLTKSTIFQPQTPTTPIQILGLLEASGCTFDSIWVSGLTDQCLPQKTHLSAFIPINLQRDYFMPHATPERELQFARQLLERLKNGSTDSVFSYPRLTGDSPNLPSPLISHLPELTLSALSETAQTPCLIKQDEDYILPLATPELVSGGTALLANQAKCPFRAFATHRLHAKPALSMTDGPDLSERGQIMHQIMEVLWQKLGGQQQLLTLKQEQLQQLITNVIQKVLTPLCNERKQSFPPLIQDVEFSRLQQIVNTCLAWEKQRPPFKIDALEKEFVINLAGMDFRVRIDRLDRVADDKKWVIDYKSSLPLSKPWNEERPEALQLLIYALLDNNINTLLFLQLKTGRVTCSGLSETVLPIQGVGTLKKDEHWADRQNQWHQQLTQLAKEFRDGHCAPTPNHSTTCQQCDFPSLCRIDRRVK